MSKNFRFCIPSALRSSTSSYNSMKANYDVKLKKVNWDPRYGAFSKIWPLPALQLLTGLHSVEKFPKEQQILGLS